MSNSINNGSSGGNLFAADLQNKVANNELPSNVATDATSLLNALSTSDGEDDTGIDDSSEYDSGEYDSGSGSLYASNYGSGEASAYSSTGTSSGSTSVTQAAGALEGDAGFYATQSGGSDTLDQAVFDAEALQEEQTAESGGDSQGTQLANLFQQYCGMQGIQPSQNNFSTFIQAFGSAADNNPQFAAAAQQVQSQLASGDGGSSQFAWMNSTANLNGASSAQETAAGMNGELEPAEYLDSDAF